MNYELRMRVEDVGWRKEGVFVGTQFIASVCVRRGGLSVRPNKCDRRSLPYYSPLLGTAVSAPCKHRLQGYPTDFVCG